MPRAARPDPGQMDVRQSETVLDELLDIGRFRAFNLPGRPSTTALNAGHAASGGEAGRRARSDSLISCSTKTS